LIETRKHENALRILFQQTLVSIGDGLISVDTRQRIRLMNPVAEQLTGWTQLEAKDRHISEVFRIVREDTEEPTEIPFDRIIKEGAILGLANHTDLISQSGERIPIDDSGAPIRAANGEIAGAVLVFRNVRDRRTAERALVRLNEDLNQFTYAATLDLREPLRMVTVHAQLLQLRVGEELGAQANEYVGQIVRGAERMARLIDGLLEFTRASELGMAQPRAADAAQGLSHALENLQMALNESAAEVTQGTMPVVLAELPHVSLIFQNLISNAIKCRHSGTAPKIHISAHRDANFWIFAVRDNGIGIDEADQRKIFIPFKRLHGPEITGAGIGLATCRRIVERYKGRIWVESTPPTGSVFYFTLPAAEGATHVS
jgi:PAS domain S-box-containing protein